MSCLPTQPIDDPESEQVELENRAWCRFVNTSTRSIELQTMELKQQYFFDHSQERICIGRDPRNGIVLKHGGVSSRHCLIEKGDDDESFFVTDLSSNGTHLDSVRLEKGVRRRSHFGSKVDILRLGAGRVSFVIQKPVTLNSMGHRQRYRLLRHLGHGAYATVRLCIDTTTGLQYAMKICDLTKLGISFKDNMANTIQPIDLNDTNMCDKERALLSEVSILNNLEHHAIVKIHDFFRSQNRLHIILDYLPAGDLLEYMLKQRRPFTEDESRDIFAQLVEATEYLHARNIVHRDIKPENILLDNTEVAYHQRTHQNMMNDASLNPMSNSQLATTTSSLHVTKSLLDSYSKLPPLGASGLRAKLTDFGLSRVVNIGDKMKTICGTPQYLAPEVLVMTDRRHHSASFATTGYDKSVDLWSLGAILFVLLTLSSPFPEDGLVDAAKEGKYNHQRLARLSPEAQDLVSKLLTVDPKRRYTIQQTKEHPWIRDLLKEREEWVMQRQQPESGQEMNQLQQHQEEGVIASKEGDDHSLPAGSSSPSPSPAAVPQSSPVVTTPAKRGVRSLARMSNPGDHDDEDGSYDGHHHHHHHADQAIGHNTKRTRH